MRSSERLDPADTGFTTVHRKRHKHQESNKNELHNEAAPIPLPTKPIIVENVNLSIVQKSTKLAGLIKREKPNYARVHSIKPLRNSAIMIHAYERSANIFLQPWAHDSELGNPNPRLPPRQKNSTLCYCNLWDKP